MPTDPSALYRLRDGVYAPDLLLVAVAELDLFSWLSDRSSADAETICRELGLAERPVDVMLTYLVVLGLLVRVEGRVTPTTLALEHLRSGSPYDLRPYYSSLKERPACRELLDILRTGEPAPWASADRGQSWEERLDDAEFAAGITAAMDARGRYLAPALGDALGGLGASRVLDIGGSSGVYLCALVDSQPGVRGAVLERPPMDIAARTLLTRRGYQDRIDVVTGDMFVDPLPTGYDLHLYSHVLHDWGERQVRSLLDASFAALPPGGWLVDHDVHINADKTGSRAAAEYSVLLMHATRGKCWSISELGEFLTDSGFVDLTCADTAADRSAVIARKPVAVT